MSRILDGVRSPADLRELTGDQLSLLCAEIRDFLVEKVSRTGGHLGPNLGVVELTIALHRVFDSPTEPILFDVGHQAYVHKILTGRRDGFDLLKRTGGMAWEALNNIAVAKDSRLVIVVNDNGRSYQPTIGGLATHLASVRVSQRYEQVLEYIKTSLSRTPLVGPPLYETLHGIKKGIKDVLQPQVLFEDLGIKYLGPVNGHDEQLVEHALRRARDFGGPVIVHAITRKGFGYPPAEQNEEDCLHQVPAAAPGRGAGSPKRMWSDVFGDALAEIGARRPDVVAITAAMLYPTGLSSFAKAFPDRVFDVGIAEQHAMTSAAGLAMGNLHPVVALYATFLNRAFDQLLMDVALHKLPVTVTLDRAGVTGPDGASHHGMWDGSILQAVPGLRIAAPRDGTRIVELLNEAVEVSDGPTVLRWPKGTVGAETAAVGKLGGMDVLYRPGDGTPSDVLLAGEGPMAGMCVDAAGRLADQGIGVTVIDPRWVKPVDPALASAAAVHRLVVTVEDNGLAGGFGDAVCRLLRETGVATPVKTFGLPQEFLPHGKREEILEEAGLVPQHLAREVTEAVARLTPALAEHPQP